MVESDTPTLYGVYARNDRRKETLVRPLVDWAAESEKMGQVGDHIWNENCQECEGAGKVYPCYSCNCVWHPRCLVRKVMPRGLQAHEELVCPECVREVTQEVVSPMRLPTLGTAVPRLVVLLPRSRVALMFYMC